MGERMRGSVTMGFFLKKAPILIAPYVMFKPGV
jgi:hypothetical protein